MPALSPNCDRTTVYQTQSLSPEWVDSPEPDAAGTAHASLSFSEGSGLTLWSHPSSGRNTAPSGETCVEIAPSRPVVVGRQQGGEVPYLDPAYLPTSFVPQGGGPVPIRSGDSRDTYVSRGHFLLRSVGDGLLLLNGVPRRGGGVRPPLNGTLLLTPENRPLEAGEEYLIPHGGSVQIQLPNGTEILIRAE